MPEMPEVEYTVRQLRSSLVGPTIDEAMVFWERTIGRPDVATFRAEIAGRHITDVRRRGKFSLLDLSGDLFVAIHRRMTGNFFLLPSGWHIDTHLREEDPVAWRTKGPSFIPPHESDESLVQAASLQVLTEPVLSTKTAHCRVCFNLVDGRRLLFTDPRKFGRIELWSRQQEAEAFKGLGPEPLSENFTVAFLTEALAKGKTSIKQVLLAQDIIAGIGNIYADEALSYAGIHPLRRADSLTAAEIHLLHEGIVAVLTTGIEHGGTSFNDYRDMWGEAGDNYSHMRVYKKHRQPCGHCGTLIERIPIAQRSTHFCPACQRLTGE
ncbi:MAG: bifunctional DNA-formamidopyrimidine glycosylase/DNA-(apurinic or apyrimidinic site) lyase [Ktedonobacteraceae bacterium]|nr:bifunctional DNA-formamidopyrimidine glycosylase/DNA-(apurinic or apyrimidinic site) lyase [Ktedonobacteraceae bacterium]